MKLKSSLINLTSVLIGNMLLALGVTLFIAPTDLVMGGGTGIAFAMNHYFNIDISLAVLIINVITFICGFIILGKKFAALTIVSTVFYPVFLKVIQQIVDFYQPQFDIFIASIFGGILIGAGIGLVLRVGASTGGMDIPPLIINKFTGIATSVLIYIFDFIIIMTQAFSIDLQTLLYSIIVLMVSTFTINKMMLIGSNQIQVIIISPLYQEISTWIQQNINRGTTFLNITTGRKKEEQKAVMCVLSQRQLHRLNQGIQTIDETAFTVISQVHEVKGRGFSLPSIDL